MGNKWEGAWEEREEEKVCMCGYVHVCQKSGGRGEGGQGVGEILHVCIHLHNIQ